MKFHSVSCSAAAEPTVATVPPGLVVTDSARSRFDAASLLAATACVVWLSSVNDAEATVLRPDPSPRPLPESNRVARPDAFWKAALDSPGADRLPWNAPT